MMRIARYACLALTMTVGISGVAIAQRGAAGLTVVAAGSEQALRLRGTTLSRPFGADLVDRIAVVGRYPVGRESYYLVRGDTAGTCPSRYVVVHDRPGQTPLVSAPFGDCMPDARGRVSGGRFVITMSAPVPGAPPVRYAYAQGSVGLLDPATAASFGRENMSLGCPAASVAEASAEPLAVTLDRDLPEELRHGGSIRRLDIAPPEMREIVARLACLSTRPGADPLVFKAAVPLFASHRYGRHAFDALDAVARTPGADTTLVASARQFAAQMNYFVARREPL